MSTKPLIHRLLEKPVSGEEIELRSFEIIEQLCPNVTTRGEEWTVLQRLIHASGDVGLAEALKVSPGAIDAGVAALERGAPIIVDAQMIRAGLSLPRLRRANPRYQRSDISCHVADEDVARNSKESGLPRSLFALRKARPKLDGALVVFGNSPVALLELNRLILEEGVAPALVLGFPVGFVNVEEAKEELKRLDVPSLILSGGRGGSPLAVAAIHALCGLAESRQASAESSDAANETPSIRHGAEAVILLGHGTRVPGADTSMVRVVEQIRSRVDGIRIESCAMSRLGPHFPETFEKVVADGARRVLVIPYFLHTGVHIQLDIPEMLQESAQQHPHVEVVYGDYLGFDESLVDIVERRIAAARAGSDVREMELPPRDAFPIPPGQMEFVPMPPEMAEQWFEKHGHHHE